MTPTIPTLGQALDLHPVIGVLSGPERLPAFLQADAQAVLIANTELRLLPSVVNAVHGAGRLAVINIDSIPGLMQDRGGVGFLGVLGVRAVTTTRSSLCPRIKALGMESVQKVFLTDRTSLPRMLASVRSGKPDYVQLMPRPVAALLSEEDLAGFGRHIVSGFVSTPGDVTEAVERGASGVSSQNKDLWAIDGLKG